ncbi:hypothetical protein ACRALDRAFT_1060035 [Sodiomyces alcalophilus JCM 7366]|uniref:uncharacterized protein n=1 Tax=Sodiomyces alcalophilus JCM 7366 TaxID=591952 RepID=UPI0039B3B4F7
MTSRPPWENLLSWHFTPGDQVDADDFVNRVVNAEKARELVIRLGKDTVFHRGWCGPRAVRTQEPNMDMICVDQRGLCGGTCELCHRATGSLGSPDDDPQPQPDMFSWKAYNTSHLHGPQPEWWDRMREHIDATGPGYGRTGEYDAHEDRWSTSAYFDFLAPESGELGVWPRGGGIPPIAGCTAVLVASSRGVWAAHLWEVPAFTKGSGTAEHQDIERLFPDGQDVYFRKMVTEFLRAGNTRGGRRNPGLEEHANEFDWTKEPFVHAIIITPQAGAGRDRVAYPEQVEAIKRVLRDTVEIADEEMQVYLYVPAPSLGIERHIGSQLAYDGLTSWQYSPSHHITVRGESRWVRKLQVQFNAHPIYEQHWCLGGETFGVPTSDSIDDFYVPESCPSVMPTATGERCESDAGCRNHECVGANEEARCTYMGFMQGEDEMESIRLDRFCTCVDISVG